MKKIEICREDVKNGGESSLGRCFYSINLVFGGITAINCFWVQHRLNLSVKNIKIGPILM